MFNKLYELVLWKTPIALFLLLSGASSLEVSAQVIGEPGEELSFIFHFYYDDAGNRIRRVVGSPYEEATGRKANTKPQTLAELKALEAEMNPNQVFDINQWFVYPNPFTEQVSLEFLNFQDAHFNVYTPAGKLVLTGKLTDVKTPITLSFLADGYYYISLHREGSVLSTKKLVKIKP
jgi:hypothetical protein